MLDEIWNIKGFKQFFKSIYGQESFNAVSCQTVNSSISVCKWIELELKGLKITLSQLFKIYKNDTIPFNYSSIDVRTEPLLSAI